MHPLLSRLSGLAALAAWTVCLGASVIAGWEDHLARAGSRHASEIAMRLAPGDARNYTTLASLDGADRTRLLQREVAVSPFDSKAWIELGLDAELQGARSRAERCLLQAARVDKTYAPRWSLVNFYFRGNSREKFWPWLHGAARMAYGDPRPLARLAWNLAEDAPEAVTALRDRPAVLESYISLLLDNQRLGPAETAIGTLLDTAGRDAAKPVSFYCDRFLDAGRPETALRLWNRLAARRWIPFAPLDPERGPHLTNGDFSSDPLSRGFDWRPQGVEGVRIVWQPARGGLRFAFSGEQPEYCMVLLQRVALAPGRRWRLAFEYRTQDLPPATGLRWRTVGAEWQAPASEDWRMAAFEFATPAGASVAPLVLAYERAPGTVRTAGSFWLRRVSLEDAGPGTGTHTGSRPPALP